MIKTVALLKRKPGLTLDEFRAYYHDRHSPLSWSLMPPEVAQGITLYLQNHARPRRPGAGDAPYDCVTEIGFADKDALRAWNDWYLGPSPEAAELRADEENFMDTAARVVVVTDELDPPRTAAS
jgi:uncharacterized protein (TIGR02118 family)